MSATTTGELVAIDERRLLRRLDDLAQRGALAQGGIYRALYTPAWSSAMELVASWLKEAGLFVRRDGIAHRHGPRRRRARRRARHRRGDRSGHESLAPLRPVDADPRVCRHLRGRGQPFQHQLLGRARHRRSPRAGRSRTHPRRRRHHARRRDAFGRPRPRHCGGCRASRHRRLRRAARRARPDSRGSRAAARRRHDHRRHRAPRGDGARTARSRRRDGHDSPP